MKYKIGDQFYLKEMYGPADIIRTIVHEEPLVQGIYVVVDEYFDNKVNIHFCRDVDLDIFYDLLGNAFSGYMNSVLTRPPPPVTPNAIILGPPKCSCGADKCGGLHYKWCDKYE